MIRRLALPGALAAGLFLLLAAPAAAAPAWHLSLRPDADYFVPGPADGQAYYTLEAENSGASPTSSEQSIHLEDTLPVGAGLSAESVEFTLLPSEADSAGGAGPIAGGLAGQLCPSDLQCEYPGCVVVPEIQPGQRLIMTIRVSVPEGLSGPIVDTAKVKGGGAKTVAVSAATEVSADPPLAINGFSADLTDSAGSPYTQAGGHPYQLVTTVDLATRTASLPAGNTEGQIEPVRDPQDIAAQLPSGLVGNPQAVPTCALADFFDHECPLKTVVGTAGIRAFGGSVGALREITALYNLQPVGAYPGELGYIIGFPFILTAGLRSGSDYGLTLTSSGILPVGLQRARVVTWGVPADPSHDALRGKICPGIKWSDGHVESFAEVEAACEAMSGLGAFPHGGPAETPPVPFLSMPTRCTNQPLPFAVSSTFWQVPGEAAASTSDEPVGGCNSLNFEPEIEARPTTDRADSPSGFEFNLEVPQGCWQGKATVAEVEGALCPRRPTFMKPPRPVPKRRRSGPPKWKLPCCTTRSTASSTSRPPTRTLSKASSPPMSCSKAKA